MPVVTFRFNPRIFSVPVRPIRRWVDSDDVVHSPVATIVQSRNGVAPADLAPTSSTFCYEVTEPGGIVRYVAVPNVAGPVEYADLVPVDPATLDPTAEPDAAWQVALDALAALVGGGVGGQEYAQDEPSSVWAFTHQLGYKPAGIRVVDDDGNTIYPASVEYTTATSITLQFARPISGRAYLS